MFSAEVAAVYFVFDTAVTFSLEQRDILLVVFFTSIGITAKVEILKKGRQPIDDVIVELDADRDTELPKVFTRIHLHFVIKGRGLDPKKVERAVNLSVEKYCSATAMLEKTAKVSHDFEVVDTE